MLTAVNQSMTLYKLKFCILPEKLTYTFVKRKNMGLVLLSKTHYFREHQASHNTRKCLRSQSVLQTFTSSPSLATAKSPRWHWDRSCCSLARAQRLWLPQQQLHTHTHLTPSSQRACHSSDPGTELSNPGTLFVLQRTPALQTKSIYKSTARSLCTSNSLLKGSTGMVHTEDSNTHSTALAEAAHITFLYQVT